MAESLSRPIDGFGVQSSPNTGLRTEEQFRQWRSRSIYSGKDRLRRTIEVYIME